MGSEAEDAMDLRTLRTRTGSRAGVRACGRVQIRRSVGVSRQEVRIGMEIGKKHEHDDDEIEDLLKVKVKKT